MTAIHHHIPDDLLLGYAQGALAQGWSLAVATHLALCPHCRRTVAGFEQIGGAAIDAVEPATMGEDALARTLARAKAAPAEAKPAPAPSGAAPVFPQPLRDFAGGDCDAIRWSPIGMGIRQRVLTKDQSVARLLYIPPGQAVPLHGHGGPECTLVLTGALLDRGAAYVRGDVEMTDHDLVHQPIAGEGEPCIALAVTDAPLVFKTFFPRLFQPWIGI